MKTISTRLLGFLALTFIITGIASPHAHANLGGSDTPSKYAAVDQDGGVSAPGIGTEFFCEFRDSARVYCWRDATPGEIATGNGDQNKGTNSEKTFWYDPAKSKAAGHDVFIPDNGAKISEYGYLHFPESASGNYRLAQVSTNATDGSNGLPDNDVNTTGIKTPAAKGVCSIALFKDGESHKCTVGTKGGNVKLGTTTVTTNIKTGYSEIDAYEEANKKCDKGGLGFVLCPIRDMMLDTVNTLNEWLASLLDINTDGFLNPTLMEASRNVLTLANSFYALIFLVIIFANAFSIGLDSYALKKMVPRLVAAIILSQFAFFITGAIIEIGNILGRGVSAFFLSLAPETASRVGGGAAVSLGILSGLTILVLLLMIMIVIIAFLVVLAILALRWATLYALILIAPLAFAAKVLPNTDKLFKAWWTNLIKLVMMFPIIMAITSGAAFLSSVMISSDSPFAIQIVGALLPFLGFLMIPKAFKWSGGIMAATGGKLSSWAGGKTKSAAKDAWSKEGGYKDRIDKGGKGRVPTTLGPITSMREQERVKRMGKAAVRVKSEEEGWTKGLDKDQLTAYATGSNKKMAATAQKVLASKYDEDLEKEKVAAARGEAPNTDRLKGLEKISNVLNVLPPDNKSRRNLGHEGSSSMPASGDLGVLRDIRAAVSKNNNNRSTTPTLTTPTTPTRTTTPPSPPAPPAPPPPAPRPPLPPLPPSGPPHP